MFSGSTGADVKGLKNHVDGSSNLHLKTNHILVLSADQGFYTKVDV